MAGGSSSGSKACLEKELALRVTGFRFSANTYKA